MTDNTPTLSKNEAENRFELRLGDDLIGQIDYKEREEGVDMYHTEVDPNHGGQGYGQKLVEFALDDARENGYLVIPTCPFIAKHIEQNSDLESLRAWTAPVSG